MELLFDNNRLIIEELYDIISVYKVKYGLKNKLPDDTFKSLKYAIKLDKDIGNTNKSIIEEMEKEHLIEFNAKQLELVCESIKDFNENATRKYYNIKQVQVKNLLINNLL